MSVIETLENNGLSRPAIRQVLYGLHDLHGWSKSDARYNSLTEWLGVWRDQGLIEFGRLYDGSGERDRPYTSREIAELLEIWQNATPAHLPADGILRVLLVEHGALVHQIENWFDGQAIVVSSEGQLRRENLWSAVQDWKMMAEELHAKQIVVYGLFDYDVYGIGHIYHAHKSWLNKRGLELRLFGLTKAQLDHCHLEEEPPPQIDGAFAIDTAWWKEQISSLLGIPLKPRRDNQGAEDAR
jgi:hypothetical protein